MGVCRVQALIPAPLSQVWEFLIRPEHMHLGGPLTRPLQAGDRVTQWRKDFFRRYSQVVLIEEIVPARSLHLRDLSKTALKLDATATISIEPAKDREATWIEEAIFYSLGSSRAVQWLDHWLVKPLVQRIAAYKTGKAFRHLQAIFTEPRTTLPSPTGQKQHK